MNKSYEHELSLNEIAVRTHVAQSLLKFVMNNYMLKGTDDIGTLSKKRWLLIPMMTAIYDEVCEANCIADSLCRDNEASSAAEKDD